MRAAFAILALGLAGCGDYPDLDAGSAAARQAGYPELLSHEAVTAALTPVTKTTDPKATLAARAAALRKRAAWLRQQGLTQAERDALMP